MSSKLRVAGRDEVPEARPANPAVVGLSTDDPEPVEEARLTPGSIKGWASSLTLHAAILLVLAFLYLAPRSAPPRVIDSRLAGSDMGVEEGLSATGGLNTPIELAASPDPSPDPTTAVLKPLDMESVEASLARLPGAVKPSGGGGMNNLNPGAGNGDGFGLARFGDGGENIRGVDVKVGDPQFTLLWDSEADLDLHVIEPGGKEIYWEEPTGKFGGELDVDNTKGFGPENVYWLREVEGSDKKQKGPGPPGEYRWFVHYWGGFGGVPRPTRWKVRIKHAGRVTVVTGRFKALNEKSRVYSLKVEGPAVDTKTSATP